MNLWVILGFLAALGVILWSATMIVIAGKAGTVARYLYLALATILAVASCWTTFGYVYFWNENTRVHGWPIPFVIFQREDPNSPWLDFIGPTVLFALPMNFVIFMFLPSIVFLAVAYLRPSKNNPSA